MSEILPTALPCPECRMRGAGGQARIGNDRRNCSTCNRFAATVRQRSAQALRAAYPDQLAQMRSRIERDLYPAVVDRWIAEHPETQTIEELTT